MSKEGMQKQFDEANCTCDHKKEPLPKISEEMRNALKADFPDKAYKKHESKKYLTTLKAAYVMERMNDVFGVGRWDLTHEVISSDNNYVLMSGRIVILDYDAVVPVQYGGHATSGTGKEKADGYKSAITDILSKSASYLEIGLDMFKGLINPGSDPDHRQGSNQEAGTIPENEWQDFYKSWNQKVYAGNHVYYKGTKYVLTEKQIEYVNKYSEKK